MIIRTSFSPTACQRTMAGPGISIRHRSTPWTRPRIRYTWDNVDLHNDVIVFSPHTPDPVLYGIRGRDPEVLLKAQKMLESEPVERSQVFITNQGTDMHLIPSSIAGARNDRSYILRGFVSAEPYVIEGGHVSSKSSRPGAR